MSKIADDILGKVRVKVFKVEADDRMSLCGEDVQTDSNGKEYFDIPAHQADYISKVFPHYRIGEEFFPKDGNVNYKIAPNIIIPAVDNNLKSK